MKESTRKFIEKSETRTKLLELYPAGTAVEMPVIEEQYLILSKSKMKESVIRARARHVYLRLVDEGVWLGSIEPFVRVYHGDCFEWADKHTLHVGRGGKRLRGQTALRFRTIRGTTQSIALDKVVNVQQLHHIYQEHVKAKSH